ncbi:hypothetical protein DSO57_1006001 [Entomophthora muscae]|uniref:Uncharacterized protein n=1 Tax=Entomophthora muscae TaxID=34485 RepID=A0ACC2SKT0_9FUNG|nr:hypothetical protein DSO57_1006001 [Entomophthora muscae]
MYTCLPEIQGILKPTWRSNLALHHLVWGAAEGMAQGALVAEGFIYQACPIALRILFPDQKAMGKEGSSDPDLGQGS